jgi:hypothetical protein
VDNIFEVKSIDNIFLDIPKIKNATDLSGFSIIRGSFNKDYITSLSDHIRKKFNPKKDTRISGVYKKGSPDFQRLDLGEYKASTRFLRYFFFFPWNNDEVFSEINHIQLDILNKLSNLSTIPLPGEDTSKSNQSWMSWVLQYPVGGGFMSKHREYTKINEGDRSYVIYLCLTTRGKDFESGGAYVFNGDEKVDIENHTRAGDLVLYRGDRYHGVSGIDPHKPLEIDNISGRLILTTIYNYF